MVELQRRQVQEGEVMTRRKLKLGLILAVILAVALLLAAVMDYYHVESSWILPVIPLGLFIMAFQQRKPHKPAKSSPPER